MLETRDRGYSFPLFIRRGAKRYLLLFALFGFALLAFGVLQYWMTFNLMLGMFVGCLLRDIGWFRAIGKTWPFSQKVTDWNEVQRIADARNGDG
jgi:hypothetical protein